MANVKATDLIDFTRASKGHALAKVSYGDELVVNGGFDTDSDWEKEASWTISGGTATYDGAIHVERIYQNLSITTGKLVKISYSVKNIEAGKTAYFNVSGSTTGSPLYKAYTNHTEGDYEIITTVEEGTVGLVFVALNSGTGGSFDLDNVSVKEVLFNQPDGTLQLFEHPNNIPRIEYDADGNLLGLLIEEARTNVVTYSEDLSQGTAVNNPTITTNIATAPDGTETVDGIQDTSGGNFKRVKLFSGAVSANSTYTGSLFVKKESVETNYGGIVLGFTAGTSNSTCYGIIDAVNGTISPATANNITATFTVTDVGDFWRFSITGTDTGSNTQLEFGVYGTLSVDGSTTGTGAGSVRRVWGAQLEAGPFPTSYIKTQGSTVSRAADVASIDVDQFGYNQSEGTVTVEAKTFSNAKANHGDFALTDGVTSPDLMSGSRTGSSVAGAYSTWYRTGGSTQAFLTKLSAVEDNVFYKASFCYKANDFAQSVDGGSILSDSSGTVPSRNTVVLIGDNYYGKLNGHIKSITYTPKRLSNAKLQELTS